MVVSATKNLFKPQFEISSNISNLTGGEKEMSASPLILMWTLDFVGGAVNRNLSILSSLILMLIKSADFNLN